MIKLVGHAYTAFGKLNCQRDNVKRFKTLIRNVKTVYQKTFYKLLDPQKSLYSQFKNIILNFDPKSYGYHLWSSVSTASIRILLIIHCTRKNAIKTVTIIICYTDFKNIDLNQNQGNLNRFSKVYNVEQNLYG